VSAVVLAAYRRPELATVLERLFDLPVDEILVVANHPLHETAERTAAADERVRVLRPGRNVGVLGRNLAASEARGDLLLMLDDDSYPLPGTIETLSEAFVQFSRLAVAGGFVRDVEPDGTVIRQTEVGTFDWFLRAGRNGAEPELGFEAFFFPEGASMVRREAFLDVGGFFEPYFATCVELDLATRFVADGWETRYFPSAPFDHLKAAAGRDTEWMLRSRIRNQIWYFWRHFPAGLAARRIPAYLLFDLVECVYRRELSAWTGGVAAAWRERAVVRGARRPLPRDVLRRAEMNRGRMHAQLLRGQLRRKLARRAGR
jgi:GT2 family glycosyltransferase